jgi:hypothetical protein
VFDGVRFAVQNVEDPIQSKAVEGLADNGPQAADVELAPKRANFFAECDKSSNKRTADDVQQRQIKDDSFFAALSHKCRDHLVDLPRLRGASRHGF